MHSGIALPGRLVVLALRDRLAADGVGIVERWDEPGDVGVKVRDPDGRAVEVFWEDPPG